MLTQCQYAFTNTHKVVLVCNKVNGIFVLTTIPFLAIVYLWPF